MPAVTAFVPRDPQDCWRAFNDPTSLVAWVPGLRRAQVIAKGPRGLPAEIHFEYGSSRVYTLAYSYDVDQRVARWEPKLGRRDGVSGSVQFEPFDQGTKVTYTLEPGDARTVDADDPKVLVDAFVAWLTRSRP